MPAVGFGTPVMASKLESCCQSQPSGCSMSSKFKSPKKRSPKTPNPGRLEPTVDDLNPALSIIRNIP